MKKVVLITVMAMCLIMSTFGQSFKNYAYCELIGRGKALSNKMKIQVDFGQKTNFWKGGADKILKDANGKAIEFNSMVDAMNYFGAQGWEFVQAYVVSESGMSGAQNVYYWLLKKEITQEETKDLEDEIAK